MWAYCRILFSHRKHNKFFSHFGHAAKRSHFSKCWPPQKNAAISIKTSSQIFLQDIMSFESVINNKKWEKFNFFPPLALMVINVCS